MVGMFVLGGGGACDGCCPRICGADGPLLELGLFAKESVGFALAWGTFWCSLGVAKGLGGPINVGDSFQSPHVDEKGPQGPHLLWAPHLGLVLASTGPEGPRMFVSCQDLWGIRTGVRDVCRAPYYYVMGYSGIYAGGQVHS